MNKDIGYLKGAISRTDSIAVIAASQELEEQGVDHSLIAIWKQGQWVKNWRNTFSVTSMCQGNGKYSDVVVFMGMYGDVLIGSPSGSKFERLGAGDAAPNRLRTI